MQLNLDKLDINWEDVSLVGNSAGFKLRYGKDILCEGDYEYCRYVLEHKGEFPQEKEPFCGKDISSAKKKLSTYAIFGQRFLDGTATVGDLNKVTNLLLDGLKEGVKENDDDPFENAKIL